MKPEDIRRVLHHHLDGISIPDATRWIQGAMSQEHVPQHPHWGRLKVAATALASLAVVGGFWLGTRTRGPHTVAGPRFIGTASALNFAVPYLAKHKVSAIHVPTFLPFTVATSLKPQPALVPIVRAGTGKLPQLLSPQLPGVNHAVYWIAVSSQGAPLSVAAQIGDQHTITQLMQRQIPWVIVVASRKSLFPGGNGVDQKLFHGRYWTSSQMALYLNQVNQAEAVDWQQGKDTYTIVVTDQRVSQPELIWLARTMQSTTLRHPQAFAVVYRALVEAKAGKPQLETWVMSATPYDKGYHTQVSLSRLALLHPAHERQRLEVTLPKPPIAAHIPVVLPHQWSVFARPFFAGVSYQFNPGGYRVAWYKTTTAVTVPVNAPPKEVPFLEVTAGDLATGIMPRFDQPVLSLADYRNLVANAVVGDVADIVRIGPDKVFVTTRLTDAASFSMVQFSYRGTLFQVASPSLWHALSAACQMLGVDANNL